MPSNPDSSNSKITTIHPAPAQEAYGAHDAHGAQAESLQQPVASGQIPAPVPERLAKPPSISVRLDMSRIVFLITDLQDLPELDVCPVEQCTMRFHLLPGLLLSSAQRQIVCPLLLDGRILTAKAQLLLASMERENPFYGLSMFAKIVALPEYMDLVPPEISARLPYELVQELFPDVAASITITDDMIPRPAGRELTPERIASFKPKVPIDVQFNLPMGHRLPELCRGKIVRISLSLYARAGGLALNDRSDQLINSLSRPTRIHVASAEFEPPADSYYQLRSISSSRPVTSALPEFYEDYTDLLDPNAAYLARHGVRL